LSRLGSAAPSALGVARESADHGHRPCGPNGYASARNLGQAENVALQSCYTYGGKDCVIRAFACDTKG